MIIIGSGQKFVANCLHGLKQKNLLIHMLTIF